MDTLHLLSCRVPPAPVPCRGLQARRSAERTCPPGEREQPWRQAISTCRATSLLLRQPSARLRFALRCAAGATPETAHPSQRLVQPLPGHKAAQATSVALACVLSACLLATDFATPPAAAPLSATFAAGAVLCAAAGHAALPLLRRLKALQAIRAAGPSSHMSKSGTPTMGGVFLVPSGLVAAHAAHLCGCPPGIGAGPPLACALAALAVMAGGLLDDLLTVRGGAAARGLRPAQKLALQALPAAAFATWMQQQQAPGAALAAGCPAPVAWALAATTVMALANGVNLTDGLDGLAASAAAVTLAGLALLAPTSPVAGLCAAMAGAAVGFLRHNTHPARVFMGEFCCVLLLPSAACRSPLPLRTDTKHQSFDV